MVVGKKCTTHTHPHTHTHTHTFLPSPRDTVEFSDFTDVSSKQSEKALLRVDEPSGNVAWRSFEM